MTLKSMTGYGQGTSPSEEFPIRTEIRVVNYRFLDISIRMPPGFMKYEQKLRDLISEGVKRGRVDVFVSAPSTLTGTSTLVVDEALVSVFVETLRALAKRHDLPGEITLDMLADFRPGFSVESTPEAPEVWEPLSGSVSQALLQVQEMRNREGAILLERISEQLRGFGQDLKELEDGLANTEERVQNRILEFVRKQCEIPELDSDRLEQEVALLLVKCDISEELARLWCHLNQFDVVCQEEGPAGKRLSFISQEMLREVNTIAAKTQTKEVASLTIKMKSRIEAIREQLNNIE